MRVQRLSSAHLSDRLCCPQPQPLPAYQPSVAQHGTLFAEPQTAYDTNLWPVDFGTPMPPVAAAADPGNEYDSARLVALALRGHSEAPSAILAIVIRITSTTAITGQILNEITSRSTSTTDASRCTIASASIARSRDRITSTDISGGRGVGK